MAKVCTKKKYKQRRSSEIHTHTHAHTQTQSTHSLASATWVLFALFLKLPFPSNSFLIACNCLSLPQFPFSPSLFSLFHLFAVLFSLCLLLWRNSGNSCETQRPTKLNWATTSAGNNNYSKMWRVIANYVAITKAAQKRKKSKTKKTCGKQQEKSNNRENKQQQYLAGAWELRTCRDSAPASAPAWAAPSPPLLHFPSLPVRLPIHSSTLQLNSLIVLLYLQILPNEPKDTKTNVPSLSSKTLQQFLDLVKEKKYRKN